MQGWEALLHIADHIPKLTSSGTLKASKLLYADADGHPQTVTSVPYQLVCYRLAKSSSRYDPQDDFVHDVLDDLALQNMIYAVKNMM
jgi:hypothetical protein